ncbi:DUF488 domain-containing protein [Desulfobacterales bacterium HSG2]|nr:DUF488 domain-containing protein [Desulfobacterales bacterium HSG2]
MSKIKLFTIGFTKKSAEKFFTMLSKAGVKRVVDVRLNNSSQLAGFAKRDDLRYFLKTICDVDYIHIPELAPTKEILDEYKKNKGDWSVYEPRFLSLMAERNIEDEMTGKITDGDCLLCSEKEPDECHRRLVAEYLNDKWGNIETEHIQ